MTEIETPQQISRRWRAEGRTFRISEAVAEFERQGAEAQRAREDAILANPERYPAGLVESVRDHREAAAVR
jgi:hypothetical protein